MAELQTMRLRGARAWPARLTVHLRFLGWPAPQDPRVDHLAPLLPVGGEMGRSMSRLIFRAILEIGRCPIDLRGLLADERRIADIPCLAY